LLLFAVAVPSQLAASQQQPIAPVAPSSDAPWLECVRAYHERTKHRFERYAAGPETLDWDSPPAPFRRFEGTRARSLPRVADFDGGTFPGLERPLAGLDGVEPAAFSEASLGVLFGLALGVTAWKSSGPDRWALRSNPSSGNLHPAEGYALLQGVEGFEGGVYHYCPDEHALELRGEWDSATELPPRVWIALSSVLWREAWKYGERAFRYCQLDTGHAIAAFGYAAAVLGWRLRPEPQIGSTTLRRALGLDRTDDFKGGRRLDTELEEAEILIEIVRDEGAEPIDAMELERLTLRARFVGKATPIDRLPMYSWPVVNEVAEATRLRDGALPSERTALWSRAPVSLPTARAARDVILGRRSAQRFDSKFVLGRASFCRILGSLSPRACFAPTFLLEPATLDLILNVHRVEGLAPGVYLLPRVEDPSISLYSWLRARAQLRQVSSLEGAIELIELGAVAPLELARLSRAVQCHQDIAASSCFALGMFTHFENAIGSDSAGYRRVHREAGGVGHELYLQAEVEGARGTGIGCFFDDSVRQSVGLHESPFTPIYHFTLGRALVDGRIESQACGTQCEPRQGAAG
jgi:SagB-type dehydrogenase family enzyme